MLARMFNDFAPLFRLQDEMSRAFDQAAFGQAFEAARGPAARGYAASYPAVNIWEAADGAACRVEAELPGMRMENLEVTVLGNQLTLAGERKIGPADEKDASWQGVSWLRRERGQGRFARTIALPWEIDADKVEARLHDGVLTVTLPKHESARPKKVKLLPGS